jgi:hypothetical protein
MSYSMMRLTTRSHQRFADKVLALAPASRTGPCGLPVRDAGVRGDHHLGNRNGFVNFVSDFELQRGLQEGMSDPPALLATPDPHEPGGHRSPST